MKILFVDYTLPYLLKDSNYPVGGWAVELHTWLKGFHTVGVRTGVLTWKGAKMYVGRELDFDLLETYDPEKGVKILKYFYSYIPAMLNAARDYRPDVIIQACNGLSTGIMAFIAAKLTVPFLYRAANDMDVDERYKVRLKSYEQLAYRYGLHKARAVLCQNQYQHDHLRQLFPNKPLHVLHNPFDTMRDLPANKTRDKKKYIAWLGVFSAQKNMKCLLNIASKSPGIEFHIAGMPSISMDNQTGNAIEQLKKLQNVHFAGYIQRKDVLDFLANAVALLSTSHYEGFSNTFLEAFAAGTPVIAPLRVDPDHIITTNKLGLTTKNDDELPHLVDHIWKMNNLNYLHLSEKCRQYLLAHHDSVAKARELVAILQPLILPTH